MQRTRAYRREVRNKTIARKKRICRAIYCISLGGVDNPGSWYKHDGQYSKGKIHCSCKLCTYSKWYGLPTLTDMKELECLKDALKDYYEV